MKNMQEAINRDNINFKIINDWENMFTYFYWDKLSESVQMQEFLREYSKKHIYKIDKRNRFYRARIFKPIKNNTSSDKFDSEKWFWQVYLQRYFYNQEDLFKDIENFKDKKSIKKGWTGYLFEDEQLRMDILQGYQGYNAEDSGAPPKGTSVEGRANKTGEIVLYLSKDKKTCINEIKPDLDDIISIGQFQPSKSFKLMDFRNQYELSNAAHFIRAIYSNLHDDLGYLKSQIITKYIKNLGFDGVVYSSARYKDGINFAIFNPEDMKCLSSKLVKIDAIN